MDQYDSQAAELLPCSCGGNHVIIGRFKIDPVNETETFERYDEPKTHTDKCLVELRPAVAAALRDGRRDEAERFARATNRILTLETAIRTHRSQKADDRCVMDDDELYAALGDGVKCDRRVGSKAAMLQNCARFIENRCEGGGWPTYAELEAKIAEIEAEIERACADQCDYCIQLERWPLVRIVDDPLAFICVRWVHSRKIPLRPNDPPETVNCEAMTAARRVIDAAGRRLAGGRVGGLCRIDFYDAPSRGRSDEPNGWLELDGERLVAHVVTYAQGA